jgi:membrane-bound lytic murein transglycosylase D
VLRIPPHTESRPGPISVAIGESKPQQTLAQQRAQAGARQHKVQAGQTLTGIARRYDVSLQELREANGLIGSSLIKPGMRLEIPGR